MVLPPTVLGYYLIVLIGRNGVIGAWLEQWFGIRLLFTWQGAVLAAAVVAFPLIYKAARAAFEDIDVRFQQAARTLGASEWELFWRVSLPLATRGIAAGLALTFARAMGEFGATLMVAGNLPGRTQTLSVAVYSAVQAGDDPLAFSLTLVISVLCIVLLVVAGRLLQVKHCVGEPACSTCTFAFPCIRTTATSTSTWRCAPTARALRCWAPRAPASRPCCWQSPA